MATKFGDNLKMVREQKKLSQGELASMLNMHATHLSRYERNITAPSVEVLKKIADVLGVTTDMLLYGPADQKAKDKIEDSELLTMFSKVQRLNRDDIHCIKSLLNAYLLKTNLQEQLTVWKKPRLRGLKL